MQKETMRIDGCSNVTARIERFLPRPVDHELASLLRRQVKVLTHGVIESRARRVFQCIVGCALPREDGCAVTQINCKGRDALCEVQLATQPGCGGGGRDQCQCGCSNLGPRSVDCPVVRCGWIHF